MFHAFWFDDGEPHHLEFNYLADLVNALGGKEATKELFRKQYQPKMCSGAILIQGTELIWDFDAPPVGYQPEDFTPDFEPGEEDLLNDEDGEMC
jgi:hypothetical protein